MGSAMKTLVVEDRNTQVCAHGLYSYAYLLTYTCQAFMGPALRTLIVADKETQVRVHIYIYMCAYIYIYVCIFIYI